jgi:hypothetical protein
LTACLHSAARAEVAELLDVRRIWDQAPHNAFTDLVRFRGRWYCTFREGQTHVSPDGALRIITSSDGKTWTSAALLTSPTADLRDPKVSITPAGKLMLTAVAALHPGAEAKHQTMAWFSSDGYKWSTPAAIGDPNFWLWRVTWHRGQAYAVGYRTAGGPGVRLYQSRDGLKFESLVANLFDRGEPNESSLVFLSDDTALCLLRRDGNPGSAQLGSARPPYVEWDWKDLGIKLGGPRLIQLPDGRLVAAGRLHEGKVRTGLCWLDTESERLTEFLALPSGGDTSYPGLVFHDGLLWVSYYSSHEGKTSIYLAKVKLPAR